VAQAKASSLPVGQFDNRGTTTAATKLEWKDIWTYCHLSICLPGRQGGDEVAGEAGGAEDGARAVLSSLGIRWQMSAVLGSICGL
jgi:hypothetical protein